MICSVTIWYVSVSAATFFAVGAQTATPRQTAEVTNTVDAFIAVEQRRNGLKFLYKISLSLSLLLSVFFSTHLTPNSMPKPRGTFSFVGGTCRAPALCL